MKKFAVLLLSVLILTGCAKKPQETNTITLWHWMTDRDQAFQKLAQLYEQQTGIKVKIELFAPSDSYTQKIIASSQAKILPDIYGILDNKDTFAKFIKYGFAADLTENFAQDDGAWEKALFQRAVSANRFEEGNTYGVKPGIYGVPLDVTNIQMLYNKKLLKKAGFDNPPATFQEFLDSLAALKRVGVDGLVSGWGELWMIDCFASNYAFNILGEEKIMATYRGEVPYTDKDWIDVLSIFKKLSDVDGLVKGVVTKPNKEAEQDFALERAAYAFNGSWSVNVYHGMNPNLEYGVMMPPPISSNWPLKVWGGAGSSFVVNANSPQKDKAIAFLKWLTAKEQQSFLAEQTLNLPSNRESLSSIPPVLSQYASAMDLTTHPTVWKYNELPLVSERFTKGIQAIIIGKKTPEEVAKELQEVKQQEMAKIKKP